MTKKTLDQALEAALAGEEAGDAAPLEDTSEAEGQPEASNPGGEQPEVEVAEGDKPEEAGAPEAEDKEPGQSAGGTAEPAKKAGPKPGASPTVQAQPAGTAPRSWAPAIREQWAALPRQVKDQILKREGEISRTLQESAQVRQGFMRVQEALQPYMPHLQASNIEPISAIKALFAKEYALRSGTPAQKAHLVAEIIGSYGVDIKALDDILAGAAPTERAQLSQQFEDPRFDQLIGQLKQAHEKRAAKTRQQHDQEIAALKPTAEFFDDVLPEMIEVERAAVARGQTLTLKQVYEKACLLNDNVRSVLEQRKAEEAKRKQSQKAKQARYAAGSVHSEPSPPAGSRKPSLEEALRQALDGQ